MMSAKELKEKISADPENWIIYLMDFVDDYRYYREQTALEEAFALGDERIDGIIASTIESLCCECEQSIPNWVSRVPACGKPWFVAGIENLKAIAIAQSPLHFRKRKIFVLENFLSRC